MDPIHWEWQPGPEADVPQAPSRAPPPSLRLAGYLRAASAHLPLTRRLGADVVPSGGSAPPVPAGPGANASGPQRHPPATTRVAMPLPVRTPQGAPSGSQGAPSGSQTEGQPPPLGPGPPGPGVRVAYPPAVPAPAHVTWRVPSHHNVAPSNFKSDPGASASGPARGSAGASASLRATTAPKDGARRLVEALMDATQHRQQAMFTVAQLGDLVAARGQWTLRELAKAAGFATARDLVHATPGVRVGGATTPTGQVLDCLRREPAPPSRSGHPGRTSDVAARAVPVPQAFTTSPVPTGRGPASASPVDGASGRGVTMSGAALLSAVGKALKEGPGRAHVHLSSREKMVGLGRSTAGALTVPDAGRTRCRQSHFVVHLSPLFELLSCNKLAVPHGGAKGAFVQDLHLLAFHCEGLQPGRTSGTGAAGSAALRDAAAPMAHAIFDKVTSAGAAIGAATVSTCQCVAPP